MPGKIHERKKDKVTFYSFKQSCRGNNAVFLAEMENYQKTFAKHLPVWYDKSDMETKENPHYQPPPQLQNLLPSDKAIIALLSVYIPIVRFNKGINGIKGHVCSFNQDIGYLCKKLPCLAEDCKIVHIIKKYKTADDMIKSHMFRVNQKKVLDALTWLKEHNRYYRDIPIKESPRLDEW